MRLARLAEGRSVGGRRPSLDSGRGSTLGPDLASGRTTVFASGLGSGLGWDKYPQAIREYFAYAHYGGDQDTAQFATAFDAGYRSGGLPTAVHKALDVRLAQRKAKTSHNLCYQIADLYSILGDKDQAFAWLNTAHEDHDYYLRILRVDPDFDPLRSDPRYAELVRKMGFPQ